MNSYDLKEFKTNKSKFFDKYYDIPKHIIFSLLLNSAIGINSELVEEILTVVEHEYIEYIPLILRLNDYTGFSVLTSLLASGDSDILYRIIGLIDKINYPIEKINCSHSDLQHFDTFLRCLQFEGDIITSSYLIEKLIEPFYTEKSIEAVKKLLSNQD